MFILGFFLLVIVKQYFCFDVEQCLQKVEPFAQAGGVGRSGLGVEEVQHRTHHWNRDPVYGCQIGTKFPIPNAK
jgi:hypothetical protein